MPKHCTECFFFELHTSVGTVTDVHGGTAHDNLGICRQRSPSFMRSEPHDTRAAWPQVEGADWCGDFHPRLGAN